MTSKPDECRRPEQEWERRATSEQLRGMMFVRGQAVPRPVISGSLAAKIRLAAYEAAGQTTDLNLVNSQGERLAGDCE